MEDRRVLKRLLTMLPTGLLLTVGCSAKPGPGAPAAEPPANLRRVTIYVESMIQRQGIT
jgi:hypothetical protein